MTRRMADFTTSRLRTVGAISRLMRGGAGRALHGVGGASSLPFMPTLAARFEVIVPEHSGLGESGMPDWVDTVHDLVYFDLDLSRHPPSCLAYPDRRRQPSL
jgi:hypothetical protein